MWTLNVGNARQDECDKQTDSGDQGAPGGSIKHFLPGYNPAEYGKLTCPFPFCIGELGSGLMATFWPCTLKILLLS
jgi:hypothetical protein